VRKSASALFPKFVFHCGNLLHELRKQMGTSNSMIRVPLFDLKFLVQASCTRCTNFKSAALGRFRTPRLESAHGLVQWANLARVLTSHPADMGADLRAVIWGHAILNASKQQGNGLKGGQYVPSQRLS
jgi:hypothetical protein